jgi:thiosulfate reductase cytochrome b subunit
MAAWVGLFYGILHLLLLAGVAIHKPQTAAQAPAWMGQLLQA